MTEPPTWSDRTGGEEYTDSLGRVIRVVHSRFHGIMLSIDGHAAYLGDNAEQLTNYIKEHNV